jgi:ATP-dependent exoDNAse (exonuclease V) beta subunit
VALTRARDRLYLGSVLKEGRLQPGRGSLAEVLPQPLIDLFAGVGPDVEWRASSGAVHGFRRCEASNREPANLEPPDPGSPIPDPVAPLVDAAPLRTSVASAITTDGERARFDRSTPASDRLIGTLVHRLLQRAGFGAGSTDAMRELARRLVRDDEIDERDDVAPCVDAAVTAYAAICARDDVRALYSAPRKLHEVPFTMTIDGRVLRGSVDCLVETSPGCLTVLEFKTGRERPEHRTQLDLYLRAMREAFPDATIESKLVYVEKNDEFQLVCVN